MFTRRQFLKAGTLAGASLVAPWRLRLHPALAQITAGSLDPESIPKYVTPLVIPPAMPLTARLKKKTIDYYVIGVRQFSQQILPPGMPATTVWSYGSQSKKGTFNYPAFTIEALADRPTRVTWVNGLVDGNGRYLPHILPVDPTLHWANPPGGEAGRDSRPDFTGGPTPGPYTGPVPIVTHLHGGHSAEESDGFAEAWYLPDARNIPKGYATVGSFYEEFKAKFAQKFDERWDRGTAMFQYRNDQPANTNWYHDHTLGMTRVNVYAGPAGFYLVRGGPYDLPTGELPGPAPARGDAPGKRYYEIPIAIQDRSFNEDGSLFYPSSRDFFGDVPPGGPYIPFTDVSPIWNPEFFGKTIVVNGHTWPFFQAERRRYRFRFLNGCNGRFLILKMVTGDPEVRPGVPALPFWQVGAEGGFLPSPVALDTLLMAPAERADVVIDFTDIPVGTDIYLINEGPDEPFGGGEPPGDFDWANPGTTGQVMKFAIVEVTGPDPSTPPDELSLPTPPKPGPASQTRKVSLNEEESEFFEEAPIMALLGTVDESGKPVTKGWADPITENPALGATEVWEMYNFTEDAHPIHIHEVQFEVVDRQQFGDAPKPPETWETGLKDTVIAYPGEITRVKSHFDQAGLYVWHCHIVEHEDNEMMRPYRVGP
jgi:spore coat protein A